MTSPTTYKLGFPKLKYSVVPMASGAPFQRDPTTADLYDTKVGGFYKIGTIWPNEATGGVWILSSISSGTTANWLGITDAASGNVDGPASATDNALARFDGTTGKLIQNSIGLLSDLGIMTGVRPTLPAGTTAAGTAPMKFTLGVNLTSPEAGAVEYDGTHLFYTNSVPTRKTIAQGPTSSTDLALAKYTGTGGEIQNSATTLSAADVMTFPANGGPVLTAGTRKGTGSFTAGGSGAIATTAAVTGCGIIITRTNLAGAAAALGEYITINSGVSFTVTSGDPADTSSFNWHIIG